MSCVLLLGTIGVVIEISLVTSNYEVVKVYPHKELSLTEQVDEEPIKSIPSSGIRTSHFIRRDNFSYPLNVNLSYVIRQKLVYENKPIPYVAINLHPYSYLIRPPDCNFPNGNTKNIVVFIKSSAMNMEQRIAVRSIWSELEDPAMKRVFTLGSVVGPKWRIEQESRKYHDILQESFDDHLNDTLKSMMAYNWAVKYCPMADVILFLNDNVYVELRKMAAYLRFIMEADGRNVFIGKVVQYVPPYRDKRERLFFPYEWYMSDNVPPYVRGGAYAVTFDVAHQFQLAFPYVKHLNIDDVYVGIVADKLSITPTNDGRFDPKNKNALVWECSDVATELVKKNCPLSGDNRQKLMEKKEEIKFYSKYNTTNRYLYYGLNFSYPLHINLPKYVSEALSQKKPIPYEPINPHPFKYIYRSSGCQFPVDPNGNKNILIMVKSFVGHFDLRHAIRSVWKNLGDSHIKRVFTLGYREINQSLAQAESKKYKDIIQEDFIDDYLNNTYKTIMSFNWAVRYCPQAHMVLFLDDDFYVKERQLVGYLRSIRRLKDLFLGRLIVYAPPYRKDVEKWHLTYQQYPYNRFPPYLSGGAYMATFDVVTKFQVAFPYVKYMGLDDVYLGIVAKKLSIIPRNESYFDSANSFALAKECSKDPDQLLNEQCTLIGYVIPTVEDPTDEQQDGILSHVKRLLHNTLSSLTNIITSSPGL